MSDLRITPRRLVRNRSFALDIEASPRVGYVHLAFTRGRKTYFQIDLNPDLSLALQKVELHVPGDAIEGLYTAVLRDTSGTKQVLRNAVVVSERQFESRDFLSLPQYDAWNYVFNSDGIPMKDMGTDVGFVEHPLVVSYYASSYLNLAMADSKNHAARQGLKRCMLWFEEQLTQGPDGSLLIEHQFPLESWNLPAGWTSGLTQGRVAELFLRYGRYLGTSKYNQHAEKLVRIMLVPIDQGGLLYEDQIGMASIEEFPTTPAGWSINGIGSAISSLQFVGWYLDLDWVGPLVKRVCESIESKISLFDCPDLPGSRVQLALKYLVRVRWRPDRRGVLARILAGVRSKLRGRRSGAIVLDSIELRPPIGKPYKTSPASVVVEPRMRRLEWAVEGDSVDLLDGELWLEIIFDGNCSPCDPTLSAVTTIVINCNALESGCLEVDVVTEDCIASIAQLRCQRGLNTLSVEANMHARIPGGVGRIAKHDEYYHETNLSWIWHLSDFGRLPFLRHVARRWLNSFLTGRGRVEAGREDDMEPLIADLELRKRELVSLESQPKSPAYRALRMRCQLLEEILAISRGQARAELAVSCPRKICPFSTSQISLLGQALEKVVGLNISVDGESVSYPTDDENCCWSLISSDEIVLCLSELPLHPGNSRYVEIGLELDAPNWNPKAASLRLEVAV